MADDYDIDHQWEKFSGRVTPVLCLKCARFLILNLTAIVVELNLLIKILKPVHYRMAEVCLFGLWRLVCSIDCE